MYYHLSPKDQTDRSPLKFYKIDWLRGRVQDLYSTYMDYKRSNMTRIDSNHLLIKLLTNITTPFDGDLISYTSKVESEVRRISGPLKLTSATVRGDLFEGVFYKGVKEMITVSRSNEPFTDLWWDWRDVSPITVHSHPVTHLTMFDPMVDNSPVIDSDNGLALINIDLPMMAAQYRMFKSNYPDGNYEQYLSQVAIPSMMKSHLDIVLFNKVCAELGLLKPNKIKSNLPFAQPDLDKHADDLAKEIADMLLNKGLTTQQYLSSIPTLYSDSTALVAMEQPSIMITQQSMWALHGQGVLKATFILEIAKRREHYDRMLPFVVRIKRDNVQIAQEGWYRNGLSSKTTQFLMDRWERILNRLPYDPSMESLSIWDHEDLVGI